MCLVTLNVYPSNNLIACGSILSTPNINKWNEIAKQNGYVKGSLRLKDYVPLKQLSNPDAQRWSIDTSTINYKWIVSPAADNKYRQLCAYSWYNDLWHSKEFNMQFQSCITKDNIPLKNNYFLQYGMLGMMISKYTSIIFVVDNNDRERIDASSACDSAK
eukprot:422219_1